jgi:dihydrolipoamide dehydrogenase
MAVGSSNDFDLVVLGAGTGGYTAAFRAAQLGLKVALVDEDKIGGTCLHRGCIPTKALLESAGLADRIRHATSMGITLPGEPTIDYEAMAANKDAVVKRMWTGLKSLVGKNKVTWIDGRGRLEGPNKIRSASPVRTARPVAAATASCRRRTSSWPPGHESRACPAWTPMARTSSPATTSCA